MLTAVQRAGKIQKYPVPVDENPYHDVCWPQVMSGMGVVQRFSISISMV